MMIPIETDGKSLVTRNKGSLNIKGEISVRRKYEAKEVSLSAFIEEMTRELNATCHRVHFDPHWFDIVIEWRRIEQTEDLKEP